MGQRVARGTSLRLRAVRRIMDEIGTAARGYETRDPPQPMRGFNRDRFAKCFCGGARILLPHLRSSSGFAGIEALEHLKQLRQNPLGVLLLLGAPDVVPQGCKERATPGDITTGDGSNRHIECRRVLSHGSKIRPYFHSKSPLSGCHERVIAELPLGKEAPHGFQKATCKDGVAPWNPLYFPARMV